MANVNFYLKEPGAKNETPINARLSWEGNRLKFSSGEKIHPKYWNSENQRVKKSCPGNVEINDFLDKVEQEIKKAYRIANTNGVNITNELLRDEVFKKLKKQTGIKRSFFDYFDEFIEVNRATKKPNTIKKYKGLFNHLKGFEQKRKVRLCFENFDSRFYELFTAYFINDLKLLNNSTGKYITTLKTFLHWATDRGYNAFDGFLKFKSPKDDADIIYLTEKELMNLYSFDLKGNTRLEQVRDSFCFGCFTGLRYSDIARLNKENVKEDEIRFTTVKTKDNLSIPLNDYAIQILERNHYQLTVISNQKMNAYLKELGELVEIDEPIVLTKYRGAEEIQFKEPKYKFITTHTARRTFVTLSLEKGMRPETVMSITGHKDYSVFKQYIKLTSKVKAVEMKRVWNKEYEEKGKLSLVS